MALLHSALAFLIAIICVQAAPQATPTFCREPIIKGRCQVVNETWYYDSGLRRCLQQRNAYCGGGRNGFPTEQLCMTCQQNVGKKGPQVCPPAPVIGGCQPRVDNWYYDYGTKRCQLFKPGECSSGRNHFPTEYKCRETCFPGLIKPPERCRNPLVRGLCHPLQHFWFYNYRKNECTRYPAGLCGAGPNMFLSKAECSTACKRPFGKKPRTCLDKPRIGSCQSRFAWFFDPITGRCRMFRHGDCGTGSNYFASELKCKKECLRIGDPYPVCSAKPISAYCLGYSTNWYFDQSANNCFRFNGGWCGKNANGFVSHRACMDYCSYPDPPNYSPPSKNDIPPMQQQQLLQQVKGTGK
uniref:Putative secreted protein n=1 Tax=Rhipicephalus microplus TaxID=6941 RepID=Q3HYC9_RHIMP|nr:putative secreted protein [Rhipicephalus microplus]